MLGLGALFRFFLAVSLFLLSDGFAQSADVLTSRNDLARTGANLSETILNPSNVNPGSFGKRFTFFLGDPSPAPADIYAQPLFVSSLTIPGRGIYDVLLVATTNNHLYAFDANAELAGTSVSPALPAGTATRTTPLWDHNFGKPPSMEDVWRIGNCHNDPNCVLPADNVTHDGNVGMMSTPVIDRSRNLIFVVNRVINGTKPNDIIEYKINALDLFDGHVVGSQTIAASKFGIGFNPTVHNQRPGLALSKDGQIIVAFGSHADYMPYRGWVMSYSFANGHFTQDGVFVSTPDGSIIPNCAPPAPHGTMRGNPDYDSIVNNCAHGGIWMAGRAPAIDIQGDVYLQIGNGKNDMNPNVGRNFGNSLVRLDPKTLAVKDYFTPSNHIYLNDADLDFGGSGPMLIPGSDYVVGGGKQGVMFVRRKSGLGKFTSGDPDAVQNFVTGNPVGHKDRSVDHPGGPDLLHPDETAHAGHIMGGPIYWPRSQAEGLSRIYNWSEGAELRAYTTDPSLVSTPIDATTPIAMGAEIQEGHPGGILSLSANGSNSGIVWANNYEVGGHHVFLGYKPGALIKVRDGILRAYDATTLARLWNSEMIPNRDRLGNFAKFTPPTIANGRVFMATFSGKVVSYGLISGPYARPTDNDADGVGDGVDNCPAVSNASQQDADKNGRGDACDDVDGDGISDSVDNCPWTPNPRQEKTLSGTAGDACRDVDYDGVSDANDNCRFISNPDQVDMDLDLAGNACDVDLDGDGICNAPVSVFTGVGAGQPANGCPANPSDNCPGTANSNQLDSDSDGFGNACDSCPDSANTGDLDRDGTDDSCDADIDNDGIKNAEDNCPVKYNPDQAPSSQFKPGWACDPNRPSLHAGFGPDVVAAVISFRDQTLERYRIDIIPNFSKDSPAPLPKAPRFELKISVKGNFAVQILSPEGEVVAKAEKANGSVLTFEPDISFFGLSEDTHGPETDKPITIMPYVIELIPDRNLDRGRDYKVKFSLNFLPF
jgi:hypothetical protein